MDEDYAGLLSDVAEGTPLHEALEDFGLEMGGLLDWMDDNNFSADDIAVVMES